MLLLALAFACRPDAAPDTGPTAAPVEVADLALSADAEHATVLTATWTQSGDAPAWLTWTVDGEPGGASPVTDRVAGAQQALVLGVPYDADVEVRVVVDDGGELVESEPITTRTAPLPEGVPVAELLVADASAWDAASPYFLTSVTELGASFSGRWWTLILDRQGRVVWASRSLFQRVSMHVRTSYAGDALLIDQNSFWGDYDGGMKSQIVRMKIDGTVVETIDTPGLHHPFVEIDGGVLAWGAADDGDEWLTLRHPDGTIDEVWGCSDFQASLGANGSCGSNTLTWDPATGRFLYSFYSSETVIDVDPASGEAVRWFGHLPGSWSFSPEDSAFYWQHGAHVTDAGTLMLSTKNGEGGRETVVREYAFDDAGETLTEVWSFGEGDGVYGEYMGEAWRLPGGNVLHNTGSHARLREATPDGAVVWDLKWGRSEYLGRSEPLADLYALAP